MKRNHKRRGKEGQGEIYNSAARVLALAGVLLSVTVAACAPKWLYGHDNGEAYERYTEEMDNAGMPYNGYW